MSARSWTCICYLQVIINETGCLLMNNTGVDWLLSLHFRILTTPSFARGTDEDARITLSKRVFDNIK
ncbi:hypothetical protein F2P81_008648 [Scophthalmus maximus]|uniref:Uncharacterized protein n=1 Tax=Scophthalmus maximus TaxID=52904 RepID=A0A6A4T4J9_SCOMX|nr:hypothetical protein F2P81_008648 [Scophthalmus maximus]